MRLTNNLRKISTLLSAAGLLVLSGSLMAGDGYHSKYANRFETLPAISPIPANNSLTKEKVELGKMLFLSRAFQLVALLVALLVITLH